MHDTNDHDKRYMYSDKGSLILEYHKINVNHLMKTEITHNFLADYMKFQFLKLKKQNRNTNFTTLNISCSNC